MQKVASPRETDSIPPSREGTKPKSNPNAVSLRELESDLSTLEAAFAELERLRFAESEQQQSLEQCSREENEILGDSALSESVATKRLLDVRARRDLKIARLAEAHKKVALQIDLIIFDIGEELRHKFRNFAYSLYIAKEREMAETIGVLFPNGAAGVATVQQLIQMAFPLVQYRQIRNWIDVELPADPAEHLVQLRDLPGRWLRVLYDLV